MKDTALEFVEYSGLFDDDPINKTYLENRVAELVIEFAKLHVEAALKAASENASLKPAEGRFDLPDYAEEGINATVDDLDNAYYIDKDLILRSYPLENIK